MKFYHATFESHLLSIKETGLCPGQRKNWNNCEEGFVYLANNPDVAISFCESSEDTPDEIYNSGICCFEIDSKFLDVSLLFDDPNILVDENVEPSGCFAYAGSIPYSSLHLCWSKKTGYLHPTLDDRMASASARMKQQTGQAMDDPDKNISFNDLER